MKKFIVLSLSALLIMGLSATVYAQVEFKAYGGLFAGFVSSRNFGASSNSITSFWAAPFQPEDPAVAPANSGAWDRPVTFYSSYANVFLEWDAGKDIRGVFNIETCNYHSGTNTINRALTPTAVLPTIQGAEFDTGLWDTRLGQTRLRTAFVQFGVPYFGIPAPMTVTAGIIPMAVRPSFMFAMTEGAGIQLDTKYDPAAFTVIWGKMAEGKIAVADDSNFYSFEGRTKFGATSIGGYIIFNNMNTYPIVYNETAYGAPSSSYDARMWWLGVYADGKAGPLNFNFDFGYDTGTVDGNASAGIIAPDVDYSGWATQLKVAYPWQKFTFGAVGLYASGADLEKTSRTGFPGSTVANGTALSSKVKSWVFPPGDGQWVGWAESMFLGGNFASLICIPQGMQAGSWNNNISRGATGGTWVAKLFASCQAAPWYKVTLWGLYIGDTTKNGNTLGNAVKANGTLRDDKSIGWELTLVQDINIYKNLTLSFGSGVLFAGDGLDQNVPGTTRNKSPENPYMLSSKLVYMF